MFKIVCSTAHNLKFLHMDFFFLLTFCGSKESKIGYLKNKKKKGKKICRWGLIQLMLSPGKLVNTATKLPRKPKRNCPPRLAGSEWFWYKRVSEYGLTSNKSGTF